MYGRVSNGKHLLKYFVLDQDHPMFWHAFCTTVCYREFTAKAGEIKMLMECFMGIAWNVGDSLCMKILTILGNPRAILADPAFQDICDCQDRLGLRWD